jgi:hypothetical protein
MQHATPILPHRVRVVDNSGEKVTGNSYILQCIKHFRKNVKDADFLQGN